MSVTAARGFAAAGSACGIKATGAADLALVASTIGPVVAAGVFTANRAAAAPVVVSRAHIVATGGRAVAVVLNSGNANAATGPAGLDQARRTAALAAVELGCRPEEVLVCSTGLIGIPLPFGAVEAGIAGLVAALDPGPRGAARAAAAILTTDTRTKEVVLTGDGVTVGGMAKGAAMLAPDLVGPSATMLAVLTTDAEVDPATLGAGLEAAVAGSFNALTVDGCTSTNDTVLVLASGVAGPPTPGVLEDLLAAACADLAGQMADDAEGATKVATVTVTGARTVADARRAARRIAESQLVQCSLAGADPYWGRVVSEAGSSGAELDPDRLSVRYGGVEVCRAGAAAPHDAAAVAAHMAGRHLAIEVDLGLGPGTATLTTTALSHAYVDENMGTS